MPLRKAEFSFIQQGIAQSAFQPFNLILAKVDSSGGSGLRISADVPMNYIFGPVNSRRLGRSLGIDLFREKVCSLNCIYCEVGATTRLTCERAEYAPTAAIKAEIDAFFADQERAAAVDFVTVTASGEPTLHSGLGDILAHLKRRAAKPRCGADQRHSALGRAGAARAGGGGCGYSLAGFRLACRIQAD